MVRWADGVVADTESEGAVSMRRRLHRLLTQDRDSLMKLQQSAHGVQKARRKAEMFLKTYEAWYALPLRVLCLYVDVVVL